jgi:hypothetical protein
MRTAAILFAGAALALLVAPARAQVDCEAERCAVRAALNDPVDGCPCDDPRFENHGRYVSCVAHVVRRLWREGSISTRCKGKVKRCAARSTCNKPGFITCTVPTDTCNTETGTCVSRPRVTCTADPDCYRCTTKRDDGRCEALGGTTGQGSCCADCG